jgi:hypothetical protein
MVLARVGGTSTTTDEGSGTVAVVTAKLVGQLTTGILVATAPSSTAVELVDDDDDPVELVDDGWVVEAEAEAEVEVEVEVGADRGRTVAPVVVGGRRSAWGELSAHPAARAATPTRPATRNKDSPHFPISRLFHRERRGEWRRQQRRRSRSLAPTQPREAVR